MTKGGQFLKNCELIKVIPAVGAVTTRAGKQKLN
jgi:hypothetical protein